MGRIPRRVARKIKAALDYTETGQPTSTCRKCHLPIRLAGGLWADEDGCDGCCADPTPEYMPHEPVEV